MFFLYQFQIQDDSVSDSSALNDDEDAHEISTENFFRGVTSSSTPLPRLYQLPGPIGDNATAVQIQLNGCQVNLHQMEEEIITLENVSIKCNFVFVLVQYYI